MKPINLYFAAVWAGQKSGEMGTLGVKNRLVSYHYPNQFPSWLEVTGNDKGNIILDSGAFSAWNKGAHIDIEDYIDFALEAIDKGSALNKTVRVVNLDVIPGKKGETRHLSTTQINAAAKEGFFNMKHMMEAGITPIHVFHQGESWKWLERMVDKVPYIGISPANDMSVPSRKQWVEGVFEYMYKNNVTADTHGFAVWVPDLLKDLPWTSCDAATWRLVSAYGGIYYPNGGFANPDFSKGSSSFSILSVSDKKGQKTRGGSKNESETLPDGFDLSYDAIPTHKGMADLLPGKLAMLAKDGYTFEDLQSWDTRAEINIRFFLAMEKWLNEYKKTHAYLPRSYRQPKIF